MMYTDSKTEARLRKTKGARGDASNMMYGGDR